MTIFGIDSPKVSMEFEETFFDISCDDVHWDGQSNAFLSHSDQVDDLTAPPRFSLFDTLESAEPGATVAPPFIHSDEERQPSWFAKV